MNKRYLQHFMLMAGLTTLSTALNANPGVYSVNTEVAKEAKVYTGFKKNEGANNLSYGFDPYGTYVSSFPSMNDNGDVAGRASFTYIDPYTGEEKVQWEAAVWVEGVAHRFGVYNCITANCQSRALKINNSRDVIVGSSHGNVAGTTPYFERSISWINENGEWYSNYGIFDNSIQSSVEDVNQFGNVVGSAIIGDDYIRHAQAIINGVSYTIGATNVQSLGMAINNMNYIVGSIEKEGLEQAFVWNPDQPSTMPTLLPTLNGGSAVAYDINDSLLIVGAATISSNSVRAVKWEGANVIDLGTLGGNNSIARSINNNGFIVGYAETANNTKHAFVYFDGMMYDLNQFATLEQGWVLVDAYTVNEHGQILVRAQRNNSTAMEDNAYWILSPEGFVPSEGPIMQLGNGYCQWGQADCEIVYPPAPVNNSIYQLPAGPLPLIPANQIPSAAAYVCNANCEQYSEFLPMYSSIFQAIENTGENETIVVMPGVYNESISMSFRKLLGLSREFTMISAEGLNMRPVNLKGYTELKHIAITGGNALNGGGVQISGGSNIIDDVIIQGNTASRDGGGIHGLMYSEFELTNSIISQNKAMYGGGYVSWSYGVAKVEHNKFRKNEAMYGAGVFIASYTNVFFNANIVDGNHSSRDGGGVYVNGYVYNQYIRNSLVTNNTAARYGGGVYRGGLLGSVVYGNTAGVTRYSAVVATISQNSIIWGNAGTYVTSGIYDSIVEGGAKYCRYCSNVVNENPLFVDPQNGDFRLQAGSPAIDSGKDTSNQYGQMQDDDFNGIKRGIDGDGQGLSAGSDYDIGAFEFIPFF